ncbi:hypothetical protein METP1_00865 [Methanosarcinales archaeon]|nr:hypothetical protein METP1_00865 [Methanosarcinales archaeon]
MTRTLRTRSTGDDVKFLQELLNSRVQEFQRKNALTVDGIVGPLTWGKHCADRVGDHKQPPTGRPGHVNADA